MRVSTKHTNPQGNPSLTDTHSRFRFTKWGLLGVATFLAILFITLPLAYRSIRPQYRESIKRYVPVMAFFDPQRSYTADSLPTVAANDNELNQISAALLWALQTQTATPTEQAQQVVIVTPTANILPTSTPVQTPSLPTETSMPTATTTTAPTAIALLPSASKNSGFQHIFQGWNNCGPATITMALSFYGWAEDQNFAANILKPDDEDKNVSPWQMVQFVNDYTGVKAITRMGGDLDLIRQLVNAQFPLIVETGYMPEGYDWMGHYKLVVGYDDALREFYVYDSFLGHNNFQGLPISYDSFDNFWENFNRTYIVVYDTGRESELREILGENADLAANAQNALTVARQEAQDNPNNPYAWFNMGTSYLALNMVEEAALAYDQARNTGSGIPWRMLWYQFGPFEAYYQVGRYNDVLALAQANLGTTPYVEETYYWRGMVYKAQNLNDQAITQFNLALQHNANFTPAINELAAMNSSIEGQ